MCGIFTLINRCNRHNADFIQQQFEKGRGRGPENSSLLTVGNKIQFGFHRLAINGLNDESNQPLIHNNIVLICNGEIYNYKELYAYMNVTPTTESDCEVIIHLYERYGIEHALQMLDGVFAFALLDYRPYLETETETAKLYMARDPYGVRPLYWIHPIDSKENNSFYCFASEAKMLSEFDIRSSHNISHFSPGTYAEFELSNRLLSDWQHIGQTKYHTPGFHSTISLVDLMGELGEPEAAPFRDSKIIYDIQKYLRLAVYKRCCTTERPIACLLSGGLDSSLITALVADYHQAHGLPMIETYSIGIAGSEDLKNARLVADHLGTKHTEIVLTESDFIEAVPHVIRCIESYDTTTVRASIGNWLLGKYISENSEAKVIFNGDGSDELCGGYLYMNACPDPIEYDCETRRLLKDIHAFDVLRSDKSISSHGLEPRTPFLDRTWVQQYLSIKPFVRYHPGNGQCEKFLLRTAFSPKYNSGIRLLPDEVLWRRKEAFSDGVTGQGRSLYQILQEHAESLDLNKDVTYKHNLPQTAEQRWYRNIFEEAYPGLGTLVPYFWMPKYVNATDASARTLNIYKE